MTYLFFDKNNIFLKDGNYPSKKINNKDILKYLDTPVSSSNFYVDHLYNIIKTQDHTELDIIFKNSINSYSIKDLVKDFKEEVESLPISNVLEFSWFTAIDEEKIIDFVRTKGYDGNNYYYISNYKPSKLKSMLICINNTYLLEDDKNVKFKGTKSITLRLLLDSILDELTINKNRKYNIIDVLENAEEIENKISKAKLELISLNNELNKKLEQEDYESCSEIRDKINKCNKIIENGR